MTCELCGCNDFAACRTTEGPCHWVRKGLCSACAKEADLSGGETERGSVGDLELLMTQEMAQALQDDRLVLQLSGVEGLQLLAALQLVCRHPEFAGGTREWVQQFSETLAERLAAGVPEVAPLCQAGFNPKFDAPVEGRIIAP